MSFRVDSKRIQETERKLGVTFPLMFRGIMMCDNGGSVKAAGETWWLHPILDTGDGKRFGRTCNDMVRETTAARSRHGFPPTAVAIGNNRDGDQLILLPKLNQPGELDPAVFRWDHKTHEVERLAGDFSELPNSEEPDLNE
jgi:hypothetical protein